jgi:hypothetical protein
MMPLNFSTRRESEPKRYSSSSTVPLRPPAFFLSAFRRFFEDWFVVLGKQQHGRSSQQESEYPSRR